MKTMKTERNGKTWVIPDCWLPPEGGEGDCINHESLMILNLTDADARVEVDVFFEDREPVSSPVLSVGARRIRAVRLDREEDFGVKIPRATQYALRVRSDVPVVVQYGRMDVRQANLAYYTTMAKEINGND